MTSLFLILIVIVLLNCIWLNNISSRIGVPTLLAFIVLGIVFGNVGAIPVYLDNHNIAKEVCSVALLFIMFYGGFGTRWDSIRPVLRESVLLASAGVLVTAALTGLFCHFALRWGWAESFLLGAVVSSTDAASVFSILRGKKLGLRNNTAPLLEMESGSNDPASYMLTAIMISVVNHSASGWSLVWMIFAQLAFGAGLGWCIAKAAGRAISKFNSSRTGVGYDTLFVFAVAIASYAIPDVLGGNGYLSAYIVGMMLGDEEFRSKKALVGFFDGITGLMQVLIFFLLGLLARPAMLCRAILPALAISLFLLLVARPVAVFGVLSPFHKYPVRQQCLVSFVGLRGAASIVFAIMAVAGTGALDNDLFSIVFCIVLISIAIQGTLIPPVARGLDMLDANENILKTFNDYSEGTDIQLSSIDISAGSEWDRKMVAELGLPRNILIALVLRGKDRITASGDTLLKAGDNVILVTKSYENTEMFLREKSVRRGSALDGKAIMDCDTEGLVLMVIRDSQNIIPRGDTVLHAGDRLVILRS